MLDKVLEENPNMDFDIAVAWCVNAKNSLANCHGFSPYQLAMGRNPVLPAVQDDKPPALTTKPANEIIRQNLNALHSARVAFTESEYSEKIRRALSHNVRTYSDTPILSGDSVYYKRNDQTKWIGPAVVLGKDGQQVLVKHGSYYIRVHPCRIQLSNDGRDSVKDINQSNDVSSLSNNELTMQNPTQPESGDESSSSDGDNKLPNTHPPLLPLLPQVHAIEQEGEHQHAPEQGNTPQLLQKEQEQPQLPIDTKPKRRGRPPKIQATNTAPHMHTNDAPEDLQPASNHPNSQRSTESPIGENLPSTKGLAPAQNAETSGLCKNSRTTFKLQNDSSWTEGVLHSRSGKQNGKWKHSWNIIHPDGSIKSVDLTHDVSEWSHNVDAETDTEIIECPTLVAEIDHNTETAKQRELESWRAQEVYDEVSNEGQKCVAVRWVITPKVINGVPSTKARLCAKGFQDEQPFRTDSPTWCKESSTVTHRNDAMGSPFY